MMHLPVSGYRKVLCNQHSDTLASISDLKRLQLERGHLDKAERHIEKTHTGRRKVLESYIRQH